MGKAGNALRHVLKTHGISQNRLAITMGINAGVVSRWVSEDRDPLAEALFETYRALRKLKPEAAEEFIRLFLRDAETDEG
ncbi:MAG: helix-turn-helix domain-containing protein [Phormidesmis sp. CAN_BIN44]|nr:helix-turn-helix domain-containing protein [Phormidesmis sp. CAN_BIN44]